jgi:hypothetical protein
MRRKKNHKMIKNERKNHNTYKYTTTQTTLKPQHIQIYNNHFTSKPPPNIPPYPISHPNPLNSNPLKILHLTNEKTYPAKIYTPVKCKYVSELVPERSMLSLSINTSISICVKKVKGKKKKKKKKKEFA